MVLLVLLVPIAIGVLLLAMEQLELKLLGSTSTARPDDAPLAQHSSALATSSAVHLWAVHLNALGREPEGDPGQPSATCQRRAFAG